MSILCNKIAPTQTFSSFAASTLSFIHSIFHCKQIQSFNMFYVIWFNLFTHKSRYFFIVGGNIQKLLKTHQKIFVILFLPRDFFFYCSVFFKFNMFRSLKHFLITLFNRFDLVSTAKPSFIRKTCSIFNLLFYQLQFCKPQLQKYLSKSLKLILLKLSLRQTRQYFLTIQRYLQTIDGIFQLMFLETLFFFYPFHIILHSISIFFNKQGCLKDVMSEGIHVMTDLKLRYFRNIFHILNKLVYYGFFIIFLLFLTLIVRRTLNLLLNQLILLRWVARDYLLLFYNFVQFVLEHKQNELLNQLFQFL